MSVNRKVTVPVGSRCPVCPIFSPEESAGVERSEGLLIRFIPCDGKGLIQCNGRPLVPDSIKCSLVQLRMDPLQVMLYGALFHRRTQIAAPNAMDVRTGKETGSTLRT